MDAPHGAAVSAAGFGLEGPRGPVFRDIRFTAGPGALVAVEGPSGSGRTCLLLALMGRMRATEGTAWVGRHRLPEQLAAVRRVSALGPVPGVTDLEPALTVAEHLRERALLQRRFEGSLRSLLRPRAERAAVSRLRIDTALRTAGLDVASLPRGARTAVRDLDRLEALRLSVALALVGRPRLLGVDDVDLKLSAAERATAWDLLRSVAAGGTTVLAVCREAPEDALVVPTAPRAYADDSDVQDHTAPPGDAGEDDMYDEHGPYGEDDGHHASADHDEHYACADRDEDDGHHEGADHGTGAERGGVRDGSDDEEETADAFPETRRA
ncbi:ATP-binding cassette domain-containing protein [Streptomyces sp. CC224B]|uniref:ATP-binding cassette domain-containing protein n=1 Tax=Streptomyces sp. CC224B TaxID=3044571 RepID=UPI0024A96444|nr:ATP-binding cassette domain-containing protein [Streptomyces sp. CC224B]